MENFKFSNESLRLKLDLSLFLNLKLSSHLDAFNILKSRLDLSYLFIVISATFESEKWYALPAPSGFS